MTDSQGAPEAMCVRSTSVLYASHTASGQGLEQPIAASVFLAFRVDALGALLHPRQPRSSR